MGTLHIQEYIKGDLKYIEKLFLKLKTDKKAKVKEKVLKCTTLITIMQYCQYMSNWLLDQETAINAL